MELKYASLGKRIWGGIIDAVIALVFFLFYTRWFGVKLADGTYHVTGGEALLAFLIIYLYFVVLEVAFGKTVGKMVAKTRVVNKEGKNISVGQAVVRNIMRILDALFVYLVAVITIAGSKSNRRLGDMVAKTYVIDA